MISYDVIVPSVGRASLDALIASLAAHAHPRPGRVVVVDDRPESDREPLRVAVTAPTDLMVEVVASAGRGPAAARNRGWRVCGREWVVFLDDDVVVTESWGSDLVRDLRDAPPSTAGVQGRIVVPLSEDRRPTDWERNVAGLETARWATADMAYRRSALAEVGGFDERFPRAYREDADLALRVLDRGWALGRGARTVLHPVRPAPWWVSLAKQVGNADDALMRAVHGADWRERAGAPPGRRRAHFATSLALAAGLAGALGGRRALGRAGLAAWCASTAQFAWSRIAPGPRDAREVATMAATSTVLPAVATWWSLSGVVRARRVAADGPRTRPVEAILFDRDGTLVHDVPYNGDPERVRPVPGAREAVAKARAAGMRVGVVTNQSAIGRRLLSDEQVREVNARVEQLLGPFDTWHICPHEPEAGCDCRKPRPGLVLRAARALGVRPERCAVIGDIGADVEAARRAGALGVLVPNGVTRREEVNAAPIVARDLVAAVDLFVDRPRDGR